MKFLSLTEIELRTYVIPWQIYT